MIIYEDILFIRKEALKNIADYKRGQKMIHKVVKNTLFQSEDLSRGEWGTLNQIFSLSPIEKSDPLFP